MRKLRASLPAAERAALDRGMLTLAADPVLCPKPMAGFLSIPLPSVETIERATQSKRSTTTAARDAEIARLKRQKAKLQTELKRARTKERKSATSGRPSPMMRFYTDRVAARAQRAARP